MAALLVCNFSPPVLQCRHVRQLQTHGQSGRHAKQRESGRQAERDRAERYPGRDAGNRATRSHAAVREAVQSAEGGLRNVRTHLDGGHLLEDREQSDTAQVHGCV